VIVDHGGECRRRYQHYYHNVNDVAVVVRTHK
jgi:hypothetical protein